MTNSRVVVRPVVIAVAIFTVLCIAILIVERGPYMLSSASSSVSTWLRERSFARAYEATWTPYHRAVINDDIRAIESLSRDTSVLESREAFDNTPLALAITLGKADIALALIRIGADVNARSRGLPIIASAAQLDDSASVALIEALVMHGANPCAEGDSGGSAILFAAASGNVRALRLLNAHGCLVDSATSAGYTPLMSAAYLGRSEAVKLLLSMGANVNARDSQGRTALSLASERGGSETCVSLLRSAGAR